MFFYFQILKYIVFLRYIVSAQMKNANDEGLIGFDFCIAYYQHQIEHVIHLPKKELGRITK